MQAFLQIGVNTRVLLLLKLAYAYSAHCFIASLIWNWYMSVFKVWAFHGKSSIYVLEYRSII